MSKDMNRLSSVRARTMSVDTTVWGRLEFPVAEVEADAEVHFFLVDVMALQPTMTPELLKNGHWSLSMRGRGFRLGIQAWSSKVKLSADMGKIATDAHHNDVITNVWARTHGLHTGALAELEVMKSGYQLGLDFQRHLSIAIKALTEELVNHDALPPESQAPLDDIDVVVVGGPSYSTENVYWSQHFALEGVCNGRKLSEQLEKAAASEWRRYLVNGIIKDTYITLGVDVAAHNTSKDESRPSEESRSLAEHILRKGKQH